MDKYQRPFIKQIEGKMSVWKQVGGVSLEEWRLFLHSLVGTGSSIGLFKVSDWAKEEMTAIMIRFLLRR